MRVFLFTLLLAFYAFAADAAGVFAGSVAETRMSGSLYTLLAGAAAGSFNADSVLAAEASASSDDESCDGEDCDDEDCDGDDCDESEDDSAESGGAPADSLVDSTAVAMSKIRSIPLPRQTAYTGVGLAIGLSAGVYNPTEDCDCMGVWQGQMEYFYTDWISGGFDVRFFGGDLDNDVMVMYQRYRTNLRFHKAWQKVDLYLESVLAFENTSISELRDQIHNRGKYSLEEEEDDDTDGMPSWVVGVTRDTVPDQDSLVERESKSCERMLSLDGFSVGVGMGFGVNLSRLWGLTGSVLFEYNFSKVMELSLVPGVAFNLREVWPWAKRSLSTAWIMVEFGSQRYFNNGVKDWSNYGIVGFQLGI